MFQNVALYAFSFFLPIILNGGFGYPPAKANLYAFPPYAVAIVVRCFYDFSVLD